MDDLQNEFSNTKFISNTTTPSVPIPTIPRPTVPRPIVPTIPSITASGLGNIQVPRPPVPSITASDKVPRPPVPSIPASDKVPRPPVPSIPASDKVPRPPVPSIPASGQGSIQVPRPPVPSIPANGQVPRTTVPPIGTSGQGSIQVPRTTVPSIPTSGQKLGIPGGVNVKIPKIPKSKVEKTQKKDTFEIEISDILSETKEIWGGTDDQIRILTGYFMLEKNEDIGKEFTIELLTILMKEGFEKVHEMMENNKDNISNIIWEQKRMDEGRFAIARETAILRAEDVGVKGVGKCRHCPSTELVFAEKTTRSLDEPTTIFVRCVRCNKRWKQ